MFAHEKLSVYHKVLAFTGYLTGVLPSWDKTYAFVDHLRRAARSILLNLVEGVRLRSVDGKQRKVDIALASCLECAACLDIACLRDLLRETDTVTRKRQLLEIARMLIGLRESWSRTTGIAETAEPYRTGSPTNSDAAKAVFHHERLDSYQAALQFYRWFLSGTAERVVESGITKTMDKLATSMVLNIAEGNGRFSILDQGSFLDTANSAATKLAAHLDLAVQAGMWQKQDIAQAKELLERIGAMTAAKGYR